MLTNVTQLLISFFFFFFQAEGGIRYRDVTGVQTCALPIYALEVAAAQDRRFVQTGRLVGPLHGVVMAIKDQYDTFDMRTTSGADAQYAADRPQDDATFVRRLREAGGVVVANSH